MDLRDVRGILFDLVGTLVELNPPFGEALKALHGALARRGINVEWNSFQEAYGKAYSKYFDVRHRRLVEVTNRVWLREALNYLGYGLEAADRRLDEAVEEYFQVFVADARPFSCVPEVLGSLKPRYRLALVSNFTYAPAVHSLLRRFRLTAFFDAIVTSHEAGYRKPHPEIFLGALSSLGLRPSQALMVGNSLEEDILGAVRVGINAVMVSGSAEPTSDTPSALREGVDYAAIESVCELKDKLEL